MAREYEYTRERVDLYDQDRRPLGRTKPRHGDGSRLNKDEYMLYALALLQARDGQFLITRRSLDKAWAPGAWEIPGGGADAGEDTRAAVVREVREETGLSLTGVEPVFVYSYRNDDAKSGDNYFCDIYHFKLDFAPGDVRIERDEVLAWKMASLAQIQKLKEENGFLHYARIVEALHAEERKS